jgi:hypothetical protein
VARTLLSTSCRQNCSSVNNAQEDASMVFIVLWLLGVPLGLIVLLWLLGVFS